MKKRMLALAMVIFNGMLVEAAQIQKSEVTIKAPDGVRLKGTYFTPGRFGPALLLLHQCDMDRHSWENLASAAAVAGIHVLTLDFRGYGESDGERLAGERAQQQWSGDVDAAWDYLLSQDSIDKTFLAAAGAGCGVRQAADIASRHHEIRALVLLSGDASDAAKDYIAKAPVVVFGAASEGDLPAAIGITQLIVPAWKNSQTVLKLFPGTDAGLAMLAKNPDLQSLIVNWLKSQLCCNNNVR